MPYLLLKGVFQEVNVVSPPRTVPPPPHGVPPSTPSPHPRPPPPSTPLHSQQDRHKDLKAHQTKQHSLSGSLNTRSSVPIVPVYKHTQTGNNEPVVCGREKSANILVAWKQGRGGSFVCCVPWRPVLTVWPRCVMTVAVCRHRDGVQTP